MKRLLVFILAILILFPASVAVASNISYALYKITVTISNNSTAAMDVATIFSCNTTAYIEAGYLNSSCNNSAMRDVYGEDVTYMPGYTENTTNPWCTWVDYIEEESSINQYLYMGGDTAMNGLIRYFPGEGGMTVYYDASLSLGDEFTTVCQGFVDTATNTDATAPKDFIYWDGGFTLSVGATEEIFASVDSWTLPTGNSDPESTWIDEANAYDDNTGTFAYEEIGTTSWGNYLEFTIGATDVHRLRIYATAENTTIDEIDVDIYYSAAWHDVYEGEFDAGEWLEYDLPSIGIVETTQMRVRFYNSDESNPYDAYLNEALFIESSCYCSATSIDNDEHYVQVISDGTDMDLVIDGVVEDTTALCNPVPDEGSDFLFFRNYVMLYVYYVKIFTD